MTADTQRGDIFTEYICQCTVGYSGIHCETGKCWGPVAGTGTCSEVASVKTEEWAEFSEHPAVPLPGFRPNFLSWDFRSGQGWCCCGE